MPKLILLAVLAFGQIQPEQAVTDAEKKEFLKFVVTLPTKGEFFTDEAVTKAIPYTRVLLALDQKDLERRDLYPFVALSRGLIDHEEPRQYAIKNFAKIAHPTVKLFWASVLFHQGASSPEIIAYLRRAVDSKDDSRFLAETSGPGFADFKEQVIRASEAGKLMKLELVKQHLTEVFPKYSDGFSYTTSTFVFAPGLRLYAVRPLKQRGELIAYDLVEGTASRRELPQPREFKPTYDFLHYFGEPALSINSRGDLFCRWTIEGNGDHALSLLKEGSDSPRVKRIKLYLADCFVLAAKGGAWYLIQEAGVEFIVYSVDEDLTLTCLGKIRCHQTASILDARFISKHVLHLLCREEPESRSRLRLIDFNAKERKTLHNREILRLDEGVSAAGGTILQLNDGSLHYLWGSDDHPGLEIPRGAERRQATGLYYQAEANTTILKASNGYHHRAITIGDRIVVCFTLENTPEKVFFRVIRHGTLGPVSELTAAKGREHNLWPEYMALYSEGKRIWFINTLVPNRLYELKLVDVKMP